jgi:tetratricopeptide (TPR) repeat protein
LGVEAVLDGTIQRAGDSVRVTARLMRVSDGRQLWEGSFHARLTDIFSVQDVISQKVAAAVKTKLTSAEERRLANHYTENVEAYQLYIRGRYHALKRTLPETQKAISYFQQAIAVDPAYALPYAGLADAHLSSLAADLPSNEFLPQARAAAQKAIEIDDTLADAHAELGFIIFWHDWDWGASEKQFERSLELDPNNVNAHLFYAHLLSNTGRHDEALAEAKRARELDPLNLLLNALEGQFLIHAGRTDEALAKLRETLKMDANYFLVRLYASSAYIDKGIYSEAVNEARQAREVSGARGTHAEAFLGYALAKSGKEAEARSVLEGLLKSSAERYVSAYNIALVYNGLGEHGEALAWLERAYAQRLPKMVFLKVEPKWNNLRSDPRFQDLLRRVGLTQ